MIHMNRSKASQHIRKNYGSIAKFAELAGVDRAHLLNQLNQCRALTVQMFNRINKIDPIAANLMRAQAKDHNRGPYAASRIDIDITWPTKHGQAVRAYLTKSGITLSHFMKKARIPQLDRLHKIMSGEIKPRANVRERLAAATNDTIQADQFK